MHLGADGAVSVLQQTLHGGAAVSLALIWHKILTATVARVYAAHPNPSSWSYAGVEGALAFVKDLSKNSFALKVVDLKVCSLSLIDWVHPANLLLL